MQYLRNQHGQRRGGLICVVVYEDGLEQQPHVNNNGRQRRVLHARRGITKMSSIVHVPDRATRVQLRPHC